jgi:hypothetical protein
MSEQRELGEPVRSTRAAILCAVPAIAILTFYLWVAAAVPVGLAYALTGSAIFAIVIAVVLLVPVAVVTWRIVLGCVDAERRVP